MPLYVYHCAECELEIEERRPYDKADEPLDCPICAAPVSRMITVGFALSKNTPASAAGERYGQVKASHRPGCACCS